MMEARSIARRASERADGTLALLAPPPAPPRVERGRGRSERARPPVPPGDGGASDGGHGGGDGGRSEGNGPEPSPSRSGAREFAFGLLLFAICTLFLTFLVAWALLRNGPSWPREGAQPPIAGLVLSSLVLLASELSMARTARASDPRTHLVRAALLGAGFLLSQAWLWRAQLALGLRASSNAYGAIFYSLTGLHALHVLGGVAYMLLLVARRARSEQARAFGLRLCRVYWHTMAAIWLVLLVVLLGR